MPTFVLTGQLPQKTIEGYVANPEDRTPALAKLVESAGGQLRAFYYLTGDADFMMIIEAPGPESVISAAMVAGAMGTASDLTTVRAFSGEEFKAIAEKAASITNAYKTPG